MLLRGNDQVCALGQHFDGALDPAGFVDGVLEVRALLASFSCMYLLADKDYYRHVNMLVKRKVLIRVKIILCSKGLFMYNAAS